MISTATENQPSNNRRIILWRLLLLRLAVIFCIILVATIVHFGLQKKVDLIAIHIVLLIAIAYSGISFIWHQSQSTISNNALVQQLLFDTLLLAVIVYFTGRSANPFIYYWLVIVAISSTIFQGRTAALFTVLTSFLYSAMMYLDVNPHLRHMPTAFHLHLVGMWINFVGSALLITFFISRLAAALRQRQTLLAKAREETLKNEQLVGIGTVAASTVHALGTPLSTLSMLIEELADNTQSDSENANEAEVINTMHAQIQRCKDTMSKLSLLAEKQEEQITPMVVTDFAAEIRSHYSVMGASPMPTFHLVSTNESASIGHSMLLNHALINLIDNAIDAAKHQVEVDFRVREQQLEILIQDDGDGFTDDSRLQWGKPQRSGKHDGLGIGVFLANSTIEKMHGEIAILAQEAHAPHKTAMRITLPLLHEIKP